MHVVRLMIVSVLVAVWPMAATAQPSFEIASVRQNTSGSRVSVVGDYKGETFTITNASLTDIISLSYGMLSIYVGKFQAIEGVPRWAEDRYDIIAKTAGPVAPPSRDGLYRLKIGPLYLMLQSLLAERFNLAAHWETRERPGYALVVAASDGRLGPKIRRSTVDCDTYRAEYKAAREAGKSPPVPVPWWRGPICGTQGSTKSGPAPMTELLMSTQPISALAEQLALWRGQPIVDRTGLTGNFDIELTYWLEGSIDAAGPLLAEALRDQLGMRLIPQRAPVEVLVIDRVQRPTDN